MKEAKFIGALMPAHPDLQPIIQELREKYNLHEVDPDGEAINEIYLGDNKISLEEFLQDIENLVLIKTDFLPPQLATFYKIGKRSLGKPLDMEGHVFPDEAMKIINATYGFMQSQMSMLVPVLDKFYRSITQMLYVYLLTGETEEVPESWISQAVVANIFGNTVIFAMANQTTNPEITVQQFRELFKKTFGKHLPKTTDTIVSTAYYFQLKRLGKPWNFIVEEYIRLNHFSMPRDIHSKRYIEVRRKHAQNLKKNIQRSEVVLDVLIGDKKQ